MAFFSKHVVEAVPEVETSIWACQNSECTGWMREQFTFIKQPSCPLCESEMAVETRVLPEITPY